MSPRAGLSWKCVIHLETGDVSLASQPDPQVSSLMARGSLGIGLVWDVCWCG